MVVPSMLRGRLRQPLVQGLLANGGGAIVTGRTSSAQSGARCMSSPIAEAEVMATHVMRADARVLLVFGALLCLGGSITAVYVAVTNDPNRKEDRPALRRGEYIAGASVVGACALVILTLRGGK
mmetsp:Transcript_45920/g.146639  ORF Transcript_45920/g.146639 Transcript_45920/m.146639 type:complete len:124 (-) Transcript_45920:75-446(-)